jgi:hypothetical protein
MGDPGSGDNGSPELRASPNAWSTRLAELLSPHLAEVCHGSLHALLHLEDREIDTLATKELRQLVDEHRGLRELANDGPAEPAATDELKKLFCTIERSRGKALWDLLVATGEVERVDDESDAAEPRKQFSRARERFRRASRHVRRSLSGSFIGRTIYRSMVAVFLAALVGGVMISAYIFRSWRFGELSTLEIFAISILAFFPGWLFVRFLGQRAEAIWMEYVLNLHRLGVDEPGNLPRPPVTSRFFAEWVKSGAWARIYASNVYREKFNAYYGKRLAESVEKGDPRVKAETVFPVLLITAVLAAGWTAIFWDETRLTDSPVTVAGLMAFGFIGAYVFTIQMLLRRFFQSDLRASAYVHALVRLVTVLVLIPVLHQVPAIRNTRWEPIVAFAVGVFPLVAIEALVQLAARPLRMALPTLRVGYPLSQLDGINVWYETRLLEEGIEDMQNLATANVVDVLLHTKVPAGRLIEWLDQAYLYIHLPPIPESWRAQPTSTHLRDVLRTAGIRNATSLIAGVLPTRVGHEREDDKRRRDRVLKWVSEQARDKPDPKVITTVALILKEYPGLDVVRNWHNHGRTCNGPQHDEKPEHRDKLRSGEREHKDDVAPENVGG